MIQENKERKLANILIKNKLVKLYDTLSVAYPSARMKTLETGKGHPIVYKSGLAPTISTQGGVRGSRRKKMNNFVKKHYKNFYKKNGYIPKIFNPYNEIDITKKGIATTITTQCGSTTSSSAILIITEKKKC